MDDVLNIIKMLFIEDNRILRESIVALIKKQRDMKVVSIVANDENIFKMISKHKPNIVLLDFELRNQSSLQFVKLTLQHFPGTKIIVMDLFPLQTDVYEFVQAGVSGFILKDANTKQFLKTIRCVNKGSKVLPVNLTGSLFTQIINQTIIQSKPALVQEEINMTKRERQVIELITDGFSNKEIAQELNLSTYTVKSHVHNILDKLSMHTRIQIAKYAHDSDSQETTFQTLH